MNLENMSLGELIKMQERLGDQIADSHKCAEQSRVRRRTFANGSVHLVRQCQVCGRQVGGPLAKAKAAAVPNGEASLNFDETIGELLQERVRALASDRSELSARIALLQDPEGFGEHEEAVRKLAEHEARLRVALDTAAAEVHRLRWSDRMPCVIKYLQHRHPEIFDNPETASVDKFESEPQLRKWLDDWLQEDFEIHTEVPGHHIVRGTGVKIDYILFPRDHLITKGFQPGPIGLEVKYLPLIHGFSTKASRFVWQAVSYTDCEFQLNGNTVRLPRVLLFSNISFSEEERLLRTFDQSPLANDRAKWNALLELANHANVGNLEMHGTRGQRAGWRITFAAGVYFRRRGDEYTMSNARLFNKERIGNF